MNRIDRLTAMILMLQSHRVITADQVAEHFEISVRTVYRDLSALGEAGVPIVAEAGVGYHLMPGYHMPPIMFTESEAAALFMSGELAEQFGDESLKESARSALLKVRSGLPEERKDYLRRLGNALSILAPSYDAKENRSLMEIQDAVVKRRCVNLKYDTAGKGQVSERVVEALGVIYYGRHWHLIGWCRYREGFRDFRLDRVREYAVLEESFQQHENFSVVDFLEGSENESHDDFVSVIFECELWALEHILAEMPAKLTHRKDLSGQKVEIRAEAYSIEWMARWLLGFGSGVTVLGPDELRENLSSKALQVVEKYQKEKHS